MKMPRSQIKRIIREELARVLREAPKDPTIATADDGEEQEPASKGQPDNQVGKPVGKQDATPAVPGDAEEKPAEPDPADTDLEKQATGDEAGGQDDDEEDSADADETEKVGDQLTGKTIQSITANPKSKLMPGAMEIVLQFDQVPDPLKILITKTGQVKYYFRGLHNEI